jgi:hypothetical protein
MKILLPLLAAYVAFAAFSGEDAPLGVYSGLSESHSTVAFELKDKGVAEVTTEYYDGEGDDSKIIDRKVPGTWAYTAPTLTIRYGAYRDEFRRDKKCGDGLPCFRFLRSRGKKKSPLDVPYEFINWGNASGAATE